MKVFTVTGLSGSGKTTVIENIIRELVRRGYTVGTVKEIHNEAFRMDTEGKNTYRHRMAGADTVTARAYHETDILMKGHADIYELLKLYKEDYVILEGVSDANVMEIAVSKEDGSPAISGRTFCVSGRYANRHTEYMGLPVINAVTDTARLVDLLEKLTLPLVPDVDVECCGECGTDCKSLLAEYVKEGKGIERCKVLRNNIKLTVNGKPVQMVPFVQNILKNAVLAVVSELKGYEKNAKIKVEL